MRRRFFVERFEGGRAALAGEAAVHLGRVLRAQAGQEYELSDGQAVWLGRIEQVTKGEIEFALVEQLPAREPALHVTLLLSIVKFDRFECCLEKATELGVTEIVPLAAERSDVGLVRAAAKRGARWRKILLESAQQARMLRLPALMECQSVTKALGAAGEPAALRVLLLERREAPALRSILEGCSARAVTLAIGPEGGWTDAEIAAATRGEFRDASLGENILRTETAVIAALACVNYALGAGR